MPLSKAFASLTIGFLFTLIPVISESSPDNLEIKTVVSDGMGTDVPSAAQNAAQNALINVVGSFIDATNLLEKRVEIQEGVRRQTSRIDTNIKEYSQGSIQGFEIINVSEQAGLTKVTAKVSVRVEDFKTYIKKLAEGEVEVEGESLFAQAATTTKQIDNKAALFYENVIAPIVNGEVLVFKVGKPHPVSDLKFTSDKYNAKENVERMSEKYGLENLFLINVTVSLKPEFLVNMRNTLDSISDKKAIYSTAYDLDSGHFFQAIWGENSNQDIYFLMNDGKAGIEANDSLSMMNKKIPSELYLIKNIRGKLGSSSKWGKSIFEYKGLPIHNLSISLIDVNDAILQQEIVFFGSPYSDQQSKAITRIVDYTGGLTRSGVSLGFSEVPWLMLEAGSINQPWEPFKVFEQRSFDIILGIESEALAKAKKIRINLVD